MTRIKLSDYGNTAFEKLKAYVVETGDARPTAQFKTSDNYLLGSWVRTQRSNKSKLTIERKRLLESLPGWVWVASPKKK